MVPETPNGITLTPFDALFAAQMEVAEGIMRKRRNLLKKLAEQGRGDDRVRVDLAGAGGGHPRASARRTWGRGGVHDPGLPQSTLARPQQLSAHGAEVDLVSLAAAYAFGIARNQPFVDGKERTAAVACELCLQLKGCVLRAEDAAMIPCSSASPSAALAKLSSPGGCART
jgi:death-on-curing protein